MERPRKNRNPWLASLFSLSVPGLGQFYNGQTRKALIFYVSGILLVPIWWSAVVVGGFSGFAIGFLALLGFVFFVVFDAFRNARALKEVTLKPYNKWYYYVALFLVFQLLGFPDFLKSFKIPSGAMIPTIAIGDHVVADMGRYGLQMPFTDAKLFPQEIERGDIIIFPFPLDPSVDYVKRVIGVGGDTVTVDGKTVYINGKPLDEPYAYYEPARSISGSAGMPLTVTVPEGKLFMMGDNRLNSQDSRFWRDETGVPRPFVDAVTVKGKVLIVYWNHVPYKSLLSGYQLGRIGTDLQ